MATPDPDKRERALPVGRALRLVLGLVLIVVLLDASWRVDARFLFRTTLLVIVLLAVYSFVHLLERKVWGPSKT